MAPVIPSPQTWTIRLKHYKTTVMLHADPVQSIDHVKEELLKALRATTDGTLNGKPLPEDYHDILLAKPVDVNDVDMGWEKLETAESGPTKARGGKRGRPNGKKLVTLKSLGLMDLAVIAFKFRDTDKKEPKESVLNEDDMEVEMDDDDEDEEWDVEIPTFEDTYGVPNEGDIGAPRNYRG